MLLPRIGNLVILLSLSVSCFSQRWLLNADLSGAVSKSLILGFPRQGPNPTPSLDVHVGVHYAVHPRIYTGLELGVSNWRFKWIWSSSGVIGPRLDYATKENIRGLDIKAEVLFVLWERRSKGYLRLGGALSPDLAVKRKIQTFDPDSGVLLSNKKRRRTRDPEVVYYTGELGIGNRWHLFGPWAMAVEVFGAYRILPDINPLNEPLKVRAWRTGSTISLVMVL
ncbi:MAG: hypothetical protein AAGH79_14010 [Bacteroidota bacterium]